MEINVLIDEEFKEFLEVSQLQYIVEQVLVAQGASSDVELSLVITGMLVNRPFFNLYAMTNGKRALIPGRNLNNYVKNRWRIEMSKVEREFESKAEIPFETGAKITADLDKKESFIWFQR